MRIPKILLPSSLKIGGPLFGGTTVYIFFVKNHPVYPYTLWLSIFHESMSFCTFGKYLRCYTKKFFKMCLNTVTLKEL